QAFPDAVHVAVGALFFLRFVVPAISLPHNYALLGDDVQLTANERRTLLLLCKLLQQAASGARFQKEPTMLQFNDALQRHAPQVEAFFDTLIVSIFFLFLFFL